MSVFIGFRPREYFGLIILGVVMLILPISDTLL